MSPHISLPNINNIGNLSNNNNNTFQAQLPTLALASVRVARDGKTQVVA